MRRTPVLRILQILGVNAVPAAGYFGAGWSPGTTLLLYWIEGLLMGALITARIAIHRKTTRKRGHWRGSRVTGEGGAKGSLLSSFLSVAVPFNLFHGVFLAGILFLFLPQMVGGEGVAVNLQNLRIGALGMTVFLIAGFLLDLFVIAKRPFLWIEQLVTRALRRVVVVHLSIIFGMVAMAFWEAPRTFFAVFVALKTMSDLSWLLPEGDLNREPPRWLSWMSRFGKDRHGETFAESWRRTYDAEERIRRKNEEVLELEAESGP